MPWGLPKYIDNSMGHEIVPISSKTSANSLTAFHASMIPFKTREMEQFGKLTVSWLRCARMRMEYLPPPPMRFLPNIKKAVMLVLLDGEEVI